MKKIFSVLLILAMLLALASCSEEPCEMCITDEDGDGICDKCGSEIKPIIPGSSGEIQTPIIPIPGT